MTGWAVTIAGVPWVFTTHAMGTITSSSPLWWGGETGVQYADGWLLPPRGTITERARPLDGDIEVSALGITLHDASSGGSPLLSSLASVDAVHVTSTPLPSSVTAAATSITVGDGGVFTAPCFAWVNREAVRVTSIAGNTLTVTRARLGTLAKAHTVDAERAMHPEVFTAVPWTTRRKVCLWRVDDGVASLVWVGVAQRAPALAEDGATYTFSCDPLWTVLRQAPIGGELGRTALVGWSNGREHGVGGDALLHSDFDLPSGYPRARTSTTGTFRTLRAMLTSHEAAVLSRTTEAGFPIRVALAATGDYVNLSAESAGIIYLRWSVVGQPTTTVLPEPRGVGRWQLRSAIRPGVPKLQAFYGSGSVGTRCVSTVAGLPASWSATTTTEASITTSEQPALRLVVSGDWFIVMTPSSVATSGDLGPRLVDCAGPWLPRKPGAPEPTFPVVLTAPEPLQVVYRVRTDHWAYALKHSVLGLCEDGDARDWDMTSIAGVARATAGLRVARDWTFDGRRTFGALLTECCLMHGVTPVLRSGLLALHAWGWPSAGATPALTITAADIVGKPTWSRWQDGLANRVTIKGDALQITATQEHSRARFGPGRSVSIDLAGVDEQTLPVDDPLAFAREVIGRMELWSEPLSAVTVRVRGSAWSTVELGALIAVTEWMLPDGTGARGLSGARALVIARTLDLSTSTVVLEALVFPRSAYPYAPCAKVASVVSSTVAQLATGYVDGTDTYSGAVDSTTFATGDVVDLIERDTTTAWTERLTIASVDTGTNRLTFGSAMSATAQTKIGAGWVDVRSAPYADAQASQQSAWMYVADDTTRVIDGTADRERVIAP